MIPSSQHDFGKNVIPKLIEKGCVYSYNFIDENKKEALLLAGHRNH